MGTPFRQINEMQVRSLGKRDESVMERVTRVRRGRCVLVKEAMRLEDALFCTGALDTLLRSILELVAHAASIDRRPPLISGVASWFPALTAHRRNGDIVWTLYSVLSPVARRN